MFPILRKVLTQKALQNYVTNEKYRKRRTAENSNGKRMK